MYKIVLRNLSLLSLLILLRSNVLVQILKRLCYYSVLKRNVAIGKYHKFKHDEENIFILMKKYPNIPIAMSSRNGQLVELFLITMTNKESDLSTNSVTPAGWFCTSAPLLQWIPIFNKEFVMLEGLTLSFFHQKLES